MDQLEALDILNEFYFGKKPELEQLEQLFGKIRLKYGTFGNDDSRFSIRTNFKKLKNDKILITIGEVISSLFGFKTTTFTVGISNDFNAYTVALSSLDDEGNLKTNFMKQSVIINNSGMYFNKKAKYIFFVCVNQGLLLSDIFNEQEIVAILLHEIGHNFAYSVLNNSDATDRSYEKFADKFATMYGYGPELASSFGKIRSYINSDRTIAKIPIIGELMALSNIFNSLIISPFNVHPSEKERMKGIIEQLKSDIDNTPNMNIETKKILQMQIQKCEDTMDKSLAMSSDQIPEGSDNLPGKIERLYRNYVEPNMPFEIFYNNNADRTANSSTINKNINNKINSKII